MALAAVETVCPPETPLPNPSNIVDTHPIKPMKPRNSIHHTKPRAVIWMIGSLLPGLACAQTFLIDPTHNNGSFELLGPAPGAANAAKATDWDTDTDGDVTYWRQFPYVTVRGDSGTETAAATQGTKNAFLQNGNATYNLTDHVIQAGDAFTFQWDGQNAVAHNVTLIYDNAGTLVNLGAAVNSTTAGNNKTGTYTVAVGDPAIGKKIGIKLTATAGYPVVDNFRLSFIYTSPGNTDGDSLPDYYEDKYFGNNDGTATPAELALQGDAGDFDSDGLSNLTEYNLGTNPSAADSDGDCLGDGAELAGTSNLFDGTPTDPLLFDSEFDGVSDGEENGSLNVAFGSAPTNPHSANTDGDASSDNDELAYRSNPNSAASLPSPSLHDLINNNLRNGDFELKNGVPNTTKTQAWDLAAPNNIDNWTEWTGVSTAANDSGVEAGGTHGAMRGYLQSGNAVYNMTSYIGAAGNVFACSWKQATVSGKVFTMRLVYDNGGVITPVPRASAITYVAGTTGSLVYRIPAGSPAIGKSIGLGITMAGGGWAGIDEVTMNIADGDSDSDGLGDFYEDEIFGNNDGNPTPAELALQSGASDFDSDGLSNLTEINLGTNPKLADTDGDTLSDGAEVAGTSNNFNGLPTSPILADTDGDHVNDFDERGGLNVSFGNAPTNPNVADTDGDFSTDNDEISYRTNPNDAGSIPTPILHDLINNTLRNGSFETAGGVVNTTKITQWDAPAPNNIDNWTEWTGVSGAGANSGVEPGGSHGAMRGYFESGNGAYNMTQYIAAAGNVFACSWKHIDRAGMLSVRLVYDNGGVITPIQASLSTTTGAGGIGHLVYRIPAGSPAIGKTIGIGVTSVGGFLQIDEFLLNIADGDSDNDGLGDFYEDEWFGNNDGNPTPAELALQSGSSDFDNDGLSNADEFFYTTSPVDNDTDNDGLLDGPEAFGTSNAFDGSPTDPKKADTDDDGLSDSQENGALNTAHGNAPSDPHFVDTDDDGYSDYAEIVQYHTDPNVIDAPVVTDLISATLQNGGFELLGPVPGAPSVAKASAWDTDPDGDVTYWTEWAGESTATGDSGTEALAPVTEGVRRGYIQANNAVHNMTSRVIAEGDVFAVTFDQVTTAPIRFGLVYDNGGVITRLADAQVSGTGDNKRVIYVIPALSPAIGKTIGVGIKGVEGWQAFDNVRLTVAGGTSNPDSDNDGMTDVWETTYFGAGNLSETAAGDFDKDGTANLTEFRLQLVPNSGVSRFAATRGAGGVIQWPSVTGVTFRIERSTTMLPGSWTTVDAAFPGTAGTASFTDPSPPAGKAFYKIGLNP